MVVEDDSKETTLSTTAANTLIRSDLMNSAERPIPQKAIAENTGVEELAVLFRDHYKGMFRVAYRITGSQSDAEDVLQNVFVRLTPGWSTRDLSPNPRGYLYRAAINASLDVVRSRVRANAVSLD